MVKNWKISKKLIVSFGILGGLFLISIFIAFMSLNNVKSELENFYNGAFKTTNKTGDIRVTLQKVEKYLYQAGVTTDFEIGKGYIDQVDEQVVLLKEYIAFMKEALVQPEAQALLTDFEQKMESTGRFRESASSFFVANQNEEGMEVMQQAYTPLLKEANDILTELDKLGFAFADNQVENGRQTAMFSYLLMGILFIVSIFVVIYISIKTTRSIVQPIKEIEKAAKDLANGNLKTSIAYEATNELGSLADSMRNTIQTLATYISDVSYGMKQIEQGNLNVELTADFKGDFIELEQSIINVINYLNQTLLFINQSADQVAAGSDQIASGAQSLSEGATDQASSVEELVATISEVSEQVANNAKGAEDANKMAHNAGEEIKESNNQMKKMIVAMEEINHSASEIKNIIQSIEAIAAQTNLLSLNAAIEAARAGEGGKGFAVVAHEIRVLAEESAKASKNSTKLIEHSLESVEKGMFIAHETANRLGGAVKQAETVSKEAAHIAEASYAQAESINQLSQGVEAISSVIQNNSAMAEESAAASEELLGQAQTLKETIGHFKLKFKQ